MKKLIFALFGLIVCMTNVQAGDFGSALGGSFMGSTLAGVVTQPRYAPQPSRDRGDDDDYYREKRRARRLEEERDRAREAQRREHEEMKKLKREIEELKREMRSGRGKKASRRESVEERFEEELED